MQLSREGCSVLTGSRETVAPAVLSREGALAINSPDQKRRDKPTRRRLLAEDVYLSSQRQSGGSVDRYEAINQTAITSCQQCDVRTYSQRQGDEDGDRHEEQKWTLK